VYQVGTNKGIYTIHCFALLENDGEC